MIQELKIKNYLSFKDETVLSFEAVKDKTLENHQVVEIIPHVRLRRICLVYGANASGKSDLLNAFEFLRNFWFHLPEDKDEETGVVPFLMDRYTPEQPSEFSLVFFVEKIKHLYQLKIDRKKIVSEKLFIYPGSQPALIFERRMHGNVSEIIFNPKKVRICQMAKNEIIIRCLPNMSVFAAYNQVNVDIPEIERVIHWMKEQYMQAIDAETELVDFAETQMMKDKVTKNDILNFLKNADYNITNIHIQEIEKKVPDEMLSFMLKEMINMPNEEKERLKKEKMLRFTKTEFEHAVLNEDGILEYYTLPKNFQSEGTLRTLGLSSALYMVLKKNAFLAIDEIETSLHPRLLELIIKNFLMQKSQSQLLLTTHYDGLMELPHLLRKDTIWFADKQKNGATRLSALSDHKGVNRISSIQKAYKLGKFGAVPKVVI